MTYGYAIALLGVVLISAIASALGKRYFLAAFLFCADIYLWFELQDLMAVPSYDWGGPGWIILVAPPVLGIALVLGFLFDYAGVKCISTDPNKTRFRKSLLWLLFGGIIIIASGMLLIKNASIA